MVYHLTVGYYVHEYGNFMQFAIIPASPVVGSGLSQTSPGTGYQWFISCLWCVCFTDQLTTEQCSKPTMSLHRTDWLIGIPIMEDENPHTPLQSSTNRDVHQGSRSSTGKPSVGHCQSSCVIVGLGGISHRLCHVGTTIRLTKNCAWNWLMAISKSPLVSGSLATHLGAANNEARVGLLYWVYGYPMVPQWPVASCDVKWPSCWRATWGAWRGPGAEWKQNQQNPAPRCDPASEKTLYARTPIMPCGCAHGPKDGNMRWTRGICIQETWRNMCHSRK